MRRLLGTFLILSVTAWALPAAPAPLAKTEAARAVVLLDASVATAVPEAAEPNLEGLDAFIAQTMKQWKIPGLALAVVKDGEVILAKGYGTRDVDKQLPVTPQTLFAIGSITKSFTVTAGGMLVDEGAVDWDRPVQEFLPDFRLHDRMASERMTPRDLVTHRSGLPRHDPLWYNSSFSRKEMYQRLRYLEPSKDLRSTFQYNNLMFMTAGYLVERLTGKNWEVFVAERIFTPLGMGNSNFSVHDSQQNTDYALPYKKDKEKVTQVPFRVIDEVGPAGSINSNVEEMIRYVQFHLNGGKVGEKQLLSESNAQQMQSPQMVIPGALEYDELGHSSYGMGLFITSYRGHKLVHHGGGIDGFISLLSFMPRKKMGMIVLTNLSGGNPVPTIITRYVYDRLLGLEPVDWNGRLKERQKKQRESEEEAKKKGYTPRKEGTRLSHTLVEYAGEYEHPGYGVARVALGEEGLQLTFNRIESPLRHFHYDVFEVPEDPLNPFEKMKVMFLPNLQGDIDTLKLPLEPNVAEIVFKRLPAQEMRQRSFLEPLVGEYELGPTTLNISLKGDDTLILTVPGQPPYELVPLRGLRFELKGLRGFSVEFKKDAAGTVTELVSYQPNGTFVAKRK